MPNKLKAHSNERIDLVDYVHGANTYTADTAAFVNSSVLLDKRSRVLEGFYVEISDQTSTPGQITVFNGHAINHDGTLITDESLPNASSTITLAGASQSFYVEIEFYETESSQDSRAFWDPTVSNPTPIPPGVEVDITVATRITPNWRIVYPVSTSGFASTSNPNSNRIPIALLNTNGSNQITSGVNTYGSLVNASTKAEQDVIATAGSVRVIDSKLFSIGSQFTYDLGGTNPETVRTVTANDLVNNIISFTPTLSFAHQAGAILRQTGVTARFLPQENDPNDPAYSQALPTARPNDQAKRLWQGDEVRGSAYLASKSTFGTRDDLDLRALKDYVDTIAAQIRDMKFGDPRPDVTSVAPPSTFSTRPRYFDKAGGITGARTAYVTIGNGTTTFGDFNGTDQATFLAAENALPANGGTIFVKPGTYTFTATWNLSKPNVNVEGDGRVTTIITNNNGSACINVASSRVLRLENLTVNTGTGSVNVITVSNSTLFAERCELNSITTTSSGAIVAHLTDFNQPIIATSLSNSYFTGCNFLGATGIAGTMSNSMFENCVWSSAGICVGSGSSVGSNMTFSKCLFTATGDFKLAQFLILSDSKFIDCTFTGTNIGGDSLVSADTGSTVEFVGCQFTGSFTSTSAVAYGNVLNLGNLTGSGCRIVSCYFSTNGTYAKSINTTNSFCRLQVLNCILNSPVGVYSSGATTGHILITGCGFTTESAVENSCIQLVNSTVPVEIASNIFRLEASAGDKHCVYVTNTVGVFNVTLTSNTFNVTGTTFGYGVRATSTSPDSVITATGNTFTGSAAGVWRAFDTSNTIINASNNTFNDISVGSIECSMFRIGGYPAISKANITSNTFSNITLVNLSPCAIRLLIADVGNNEDVIKFEDNLISNVSVTGSGGAYIVANKNGAAANNGSVVSIKNNKFNDCNIGTTAIVRDLIFVSLGSFEITGNTFHDISSTNATSLLLIQAVSCVSLVIDNNIFESISHTSSVTCITAGSTNSSINNNTFRAITASANDVICILNASAGIISNNIFESLSAPGNVRCVDGTGTTVNTLTISSNKFNTGSVTGAVRNITAGNVSHLAVIGNTFNTSTSNSNDIVFTGSFNNITVSSNIFKSLATINVYSVQGSNTNTSKGFVVSNNTFDATGFNIANHRAIVITSSSAGVSGELQDIIISNNVINRASSTTDQAIEVTLTGGAAAGFRLHDVVITGNTITETGSVVPTGPDITITGGSNGVTFYPVQHVTVSNNSLRQNATAGTRASTSFLLVDRLVFSGNTIQRNTGANSTVSFDSVLGFAITGNVVSSDAASVIFDGASTIYANSSHGTVTGNIAETTAAIQANFTDVTSGNNDIW